jgi:transcriptional regulator with XRE-family HTH domain
MDASFGARLRAQRERQQVALTTISESTKIKVSMLEALERDDVSQWPEGIYRRAYVRAYARAVGLEPEPLVREFLEAHPDPIVAPPDTHTELENPQWPAGFRRLVTTAIGAVPPRRQPVEKTIAEPVEAEVAPSPVAEDERRPELDLVTAAALCTRLGRARGASAVRPILEDAAKALDAVGIIVWSWDSHVFALKPSVACGYAESILAHMPRVRADADNAIAAAFQSGEMCVVDRGEDMTGAVVVPILAHSGCVGVLAVELRHGDEQRGCVRDFATILAAQLVPLVGSAPLAEAVNG